MKKMILFFFAAIVLVLSGCVSSKRMARMSGGVFDEYSAPPSYQLRSARFQQKTPYADSIRRSNATQIGGLDDTLINIWPFFFRNSSYWSMLWPFIDYDKYGFAIRPFYVQDGDEYSILFPLSSWNPVSNAAGDIFDRMETVNGMIAAAHMTSFVKSSDSMGGVFHNGNVSGNGTDGIHITGGAD